MSDEENQLSHSSDEEEEEIRNDMMDLLDDEERDDPRESLLRRFRRNRGQRLANVQSSISSLFLALKRERRFNVAFFFYFVPVTFCLLVVLIVDGSNPCQFPLKTWAAAQVTLQLSLCLLSFFISRNETGRMIRGQSPRPFKIQVMRALRKIFYSFWTIWFFIGAYLIFQAHAEGSCSQTVPFLFHVNLSVVIFQLFIFSMIAFLLIFFLISLTWRCLFGVARIPPAHGGPAIQSNGAPLDVIRSLVTMKYKQGVVPEDDNSCSICLMEFEEVEEDGEEEIVKWLPCHHYFHDECITPWLERNKQCPLCKHPVDQPPPDAQIK